MGSLTLDALIADVEDRIDAQVASAVLLKAVFAPLTEQPQLLKDYGVAVVPPFEVVNEEIGHGANAEFNLFRLTVQAAFRLPLNETDRETTRNTALQFFKSIHTALTGASSWANSRHAEHEDTTIEHAGGFWVATQVYTFEGTQTVGT